MQLISQLLEHPSLVAYFSGSNNYAWLHFRNGDRLLLAKPLIYFERLLPTFIRVHKMALVNPACVARLHPPLHAKTSGLVRMQDGTELPVSRRRWDAIVELLDTNVGGTRPDGTPPNEPFAQPLLTEPLSPGELAPRLVMAVMTGDALLLTRNCLDSINFSGWLQPVEWGAELANSLLLTPNQQWPGLILLDARTNRADRMLALRSLKSHPRLRSIPVVWLTEPGDDAALLYTLDANSVVMIPDAPDEFARIIGQLCRYWLTMVQLPVDGASD